MLLNRKEQFTPPKRLVFIIDDNRMVAKSIMQMLEMLGYETQAAYGTMTAIQAMGQRPPDMIMLDLHMQGLNGVEMCRHIKSDEYLQNIPIIAMSSDTQSELIHSMRQAGAVAFVPKPISVELLEDTLKEVERIYLKH